MSGNDSRRKDGKLIDVDLYRRLRDAGTFETPVIPAPRLRLDTATLAPQAAAERIARELTHEPNK